MWQAATEMRAVQIAVRRDVQNDYRAIVVLAALATGPDGWGDALCRLGGDAVTARQRRFDVG
jgi:hypothetical protein